MSGKTERAALPQLMTIDECAKVLGVHPKTVRRRIAAGVLPVIRDGGVIRIDAKDLAVYLAANRGYRASMSKKVHVNQE